ncbi:hypothetical protein SKAU_G00252720 [Synaphobranchus kaupii]|uniref:Uncharacterized protein n=1 Tax=Synaphobranchus kaupii TaxID=118154 RepID=A0A9Q1F355_SYNKA|nr:hypothetical protein SKAU_G00252720 [Synaphobranchus kaupii]
MGVAFRNAPMTHNVMTSPNSRGHFTQLHRHLQSSANCRQTEGLEKFSLLPLPHLTTRPWLSPAKMARDCSNSPS